MAKPKRIGADPLDDLIPTRSTSKGRNQRSTVHRKRSARTKQSTSAKAPIVKGEPDATAEWEASNTRVTFYCPVSLLGQIEQEIRRSGRSKTRVVVDALREHLTAK